eukprot:TRINITY_DN2852_c0_g1_i9.p2 TRINITY_DN2852_c0_g1~~TRINITY_DN2852_c0_g1_i9.p2  ORF type:complete len:100 (-),score=10.53 TRINITY_DN2852_c0_g1_i9:258-557(-)
MRGYQGFFCYNWFCRPVPLLGALTSLCQEGRQEGSDRSILILLIFCQLCIGCRVRRKQLQEVLSVRSVQQVILIWGVQQVVDKPVNVVVYTKFCQAMVL